MRNTDIPVTRAAHYVHEDEAWLHVPGGAVKKLRDDGGFIDLPVDRLAVDSGCIDLRKVTISARGPDRNDAYGFEFDLEPEAARRLATEVALAATAAEQSGPVDPDLVTISTTKGGADDPAASLAPPTTRAACRESQGSPAWTAGLLPPEVPVDEMRYYPPRSEQERGNTWHAVPAEVLTIEDAREGRVTVGYAGRVGDEIHLYEVDLTPAAAEELALRLIRRAHDIREA